jgi:hypothetical protein
MFSFDQLRNITCWDMWLSLQLPQSLINDREDWYIWWNPHSLCLWLTLHFNTRLEWRKFSTDVIVWRLFKLNVKWGENWDWGVLISIHFYLAIRMHNRSKYLFLWTLIICTIPQCFCGWHCMLTQDQTEKNLTLRLLTGDYLNWMLNEGKTEIEERYIFILSSECMTEANIKLFLWTFIICTFPHALSAS